MDSDGINIIYAVRDEYFCEDNKKKKYKYKYFDSEYTVKSIHRDIYLNKC